LPNDIHAFLDSSGKAVRKKGDRENGRSGGWKKKENREREEGRKGEREKGKKGRWEREERKREQGRAEKAENEAVVVVAEAKTAAQRRPQSLRKRPLPKHA
jgi:hypothetical protein